MNSDESQKKSILLIEDNADDQESFVRACKKTGLSAPVVWCRSGEEALTRLRQKKKTGNGPCLLPSLIVLDLNMPGLDGRQLLHILKEDKSLKIIPVIILTTSAMEEDVRNCYQMGANTYIQKPHNFSDLVTDIGCLKQYWMEMAILPSLCKSAESLS